MRHLEAECCGVQTFALQTQIFPIFPDRGIGTVSLFAPKAKTETWGTFGNGGRGQKREGMVIKLRDSEIDRGALSKIEGTVRNEGGMIIDEKQSGMRGAWSKIKRHSQK